VAPRGPRHQALRGPVTSVESAERRRREGTAPQALLSTREEPDLAAP